MLAQLFEATLEVYNQPKSSANWIQRDVLQFVRDKDIEIEATELTPANLASLVELVDTGRLTVKNGREVFLVLAESGGDPAQIMAERSLEAVQDTGLIEGVAKEVLANNPDSVTAFREGDGKVLNFLMGQVMKATKGKASPADVKRILESELQAS